VFGQFEGLKRAEDTASKGKSQATGFYVKSKDKALRFAAVIEMVIQSFFAVRDGSASNKVLTKFTSQCINFIRADAMKGGLSCVSVCMKDVYDLHSKCIDQQSCLKTFH